MLGIQVLAPGGRKVRFGPFVSLAKVDGIHCGKENMISERGGQLTHEAAELLAVDALSFLAITPDALGRFLALSGIGPTMLRAAAAEPAFLAGVLDFFLSDERLLVSYAEQAGIPATQIAHARRALGDAG
jgi:hypothetical protein